MVDEIGRLSLCYALTLILLITLLSNLCFLCNHAIEYCRSVTNTAHRSADV